MNFDEPSPYDRYFNHQVNKPYTSDYHAHLQRLNKQDSDRRANPDNTSRKTNTTETRHGPTEYKRNFNTVTDTTNVASGFGKLAHIASEPVKENQGRENPPKTINDIPAPISIQNQQEANAKTTNETLTGVETGLETALTVGSILL